MDTTIITRTLARHMATTDRIGSTAACLLALDRGSMDFTGVAAIGAVAGEAVVGAVAVIGAAEVLTGADAVIGADVVVGVAEEASAALAVARFTNTALPGVAADSAAIAVASTAEVAVDFMAAVAADSTVVAAVDFTAGEAMAAATGN
jgi:hypothetical protein